MKFVFSFRNLAIVALATIVYALAGGRAHAGCGDYIVIRNSASVGMAGHSDFKPANSPKPCHGPNCSAHRMPESPPMVPPATVNVSAGDLALDSLLDFESESPPTRRMPPLSDCGPVHRPSPPFHPPRIAH